MNKIITVLRTLLGVLYFMFGINGFLQFLPSISSPGVRAEHFYQSIESSGYILPMIHISSIITGTSLLLNLFTPFFLLLFFPISMNFSMFYYFLGDRLFFVPEMFVPLTVNLIHTIILLSYYKKFKDLMKPR